LIIVVGEPETKLVGDDADIGWTAQFPRLNPGTLRTSSGSFFCGSPMMGSFQIAPSRGARFQDLFCGRIASARFRSDRRNGCGPAGSSAGFFGAGFGIAVIRRLRASARSKMSAAFRKARR
jgi:hypothetical protein